MSESVSKVRTFISTPLFKIILIGLLIRLLMVPFSLPYDSNYWTIVVRNIESGYGLYQAEGYYYTPVWGYVLGFISGISNAILDIGDLSVIEYEFLHYMEVNGYAYSPMAVSIVFLFLVKMVLTMSDLILSSIVYRLVKDRTGDEKKAVLAFFLTFLCPHIIGATGMIPMPDTLSSMFLMMTIMLLRDDKYFFAGIFYSLAVWVKFFPIFVILILLCYIYVETKGNKKLTAERIGKAIAGFMVMSIIIFLPQMMEGTILNSLSFIIDRINTLLMSGWLIIICAILAGIGIFFAVVFVARHMLNAEGNRDDRLMEYSFILLCVCMLPYTNLQYLVTLMPFLVYCLVVINRNYIYIWISFAVAAAMLIPMLNTNAVMLNSLVVFTGLISTSQAIALFDVLSYEIIFNRSVVDIVCMLGNNLQRMTLAAVPILFVIRKLMIKRGESSE